MKIQKTFDSNKTMVICKTEKEFEKALENREKKIVFEGPKAEEIVRKFQEAESRKKATRNTALGIGALCLLAAPFTGGASLLGLGATAGAIALSEGVIIAIIGAVVSISVAAINAIKDYKIAKIDNEKIILTHKS